jgi:hypothetical protein
MSEKNETPVHPVQTECCHRGGRCSQAVTMAAYEVYRHVFGDQRAMVEDGCRGGFGVGELIAFLYARSFPRSEWRDRVDEGLRGLRLGRMAQ